MNSRKRRRTSGNSGLRAAKSIASRRTGLIDTTDQPPAEEPPLRGSLTDKRTVGNEANLATNSALRPLEYFLQQRLPYLERNALHTRSTATRTPKYYDTHIAQKLRLKKVVCVEDLLGVLSKVCDEYVEAVLESGRDMSPSFPEFEVPSAKDILDERSLVAYFQVINMLFSRVASGLLFKTDWDAVFGFAPQALDVKPSSEGSADAYLFINRDSNALVPSRDRLDIDLIRKYDLNNFVIWEYKNLGFGYDIFRALQLQEGNFCWTACQERSARHDASSRCPGQSHRTNGRLTVTGRPTGPDAFPTIDIIRRSSFAEIYDAEEERPTKRLRRDVDPAMQKKVCSLLQQSWTSAVVQDASFMVISSGNEECIAIRHRESQTLFISSPLKPSNRAEPAYIKVYMALYIAAYKDAVNRAQQLESDCFSSYTRSLLRLRIDDKPDLPNASSSGLFDRYPAEVDLSPLSSVFVQLLTQSSCIDLRLHQYDLATTQNNPNTWTLTRFEIRQNSQIEEKATFPCSDSDSFPDIMKNAFVFLDLDRLFDETSRVWRVYFGTAHGPGNKIAYFQEPLVLKMARDDNEIGNLKIEYDRYQGLEKIGVHGIVKCYGLFTCQVNSTDERYFLLLKDGGGPISKRPGSTRLAHTKKHRKTYEAALESFHQNSYTHNNITCEHVLMDVRRGEAALISLKTCGVPDQPLTTSNKAKDIIAMGLCLGIPSEDGSRGKAKMAVSKSSESSKRGTSTSDGKVGRRSEVEINPFDIDG